jgi:hypothetical protein
VESRIKEEPCRSKLIVEFERWVNLVVHLNSLAKHAVSGIRVEMIPRPGGSAGKVSTFIEFNRLFAVKLDRRAFLASLRGNGIRLRGEKS